MDVQVGDNTISLKDNLLYSKADFWFNEADGSIGITDFAQVQLGDISFVDITLVSEGTEVTQSITTDGSEIADCSIESAKAVVEIFSPVSGSVSEVNGDLDMDPDKLNSEPYSSWIFKITPSKLDAEKANLMDAAAYAEDIKSR